MAKVLTITNISKQIIPLQVREPRSDFYVGEKQVRILPGKSVMIPESHIMPGQIENLKGRQQLKVTSGN